MLDTVLKSTFTTADTGWALQHGSFTNFNREITRTGASVLPRKRATGLSEGAYRYPHIAELELQINLGSRRSRAVARSVMWGLLRLLQNHGNEKINQMPREDQSAIWSGGSGWDYTEDFADGVPHDFGQIVDFPALYFGEDIISRDPANPTWMLYDSSPMPGSAAKVKLIGGALPLVQAQEALIDLKAQNVASDDVRMREVIRAECNDLSVLNLTSMLVPIDARLELRLRARALREA